MQSINIYPRWIYTNTISFANEQDLCIHQSVLKNLKSEIQESTFFFLLQTKEYGYSSLSRIWNVISFHFFCIHWITSNIGKLPHKLQICRCYRFILSCILLQNLILLNESIHHIENTRTIKYYQSFVFYKCFFWYFKLSVSFSWKQFLS